MRFDHIVATAAGLFGIALAQMNTTTDFDPITKPPKGDTIIAGTTYTIEWDSGAAYHPGHVNLLLEKGDSLSSLMTIGGIAGGVAGNEAQYKWDLSDDIPSGDDYYIKIVNVQDKSVFNYSGQFSIQSGNETSVRQTGTATSPSTTSTASSSGSSSSTATSTATSTDAGSAATAANDRVALLGAVAIGMLAF